MKLLALDFDGVISDSARECLTVACATWRLLEPGSALARREPDALWEPFLSLMPLGNRAEDFGIALHILERGLEVTSQEAYDAFRATLPAEWLREFHRRFYRERAALARADRAAWLAAMRPYPEMVDLLPRLAGHVDLAIATAKDGATVRAVLEHHGLAHWFPEERVLDKETGRSKARHLERLALETGVPFGRIAFVDDKLNHLDAVAPLGVRCLLAAWGYNGPREHVLARQRGYDVCQPREIEARLFA